MKPRRTRKSPTTAQLRDDIDSGRTGDKVAFPDPAAAPLGTDDEAGGSPPTPQELELARMGQRTGRPEPLDRRDHDHRHPGQRVDDALRLLAEETAEEPVPDRLLEPARSLQRAIASRRGRR